MRHCVFVVASQSQLHTLRPVIESIANTGLAVSVLATGQDSILIADAVGVTNVDVVETQSRRWPSLSSLIWLPTMMNGCLQHVAAIKTWTTQRPLVVVQGSQFTSWLGATAARWGGGNIVYLDHTGDTQDVGFFARSFRRMAAAKAHMQVAATEQADKIILNLSGVRDAQ